MEKGRNERVRKVEERIVKVREGNRKVMGKIIGKNRESKGW